MTNKVNMEFECPQFVDFAAELEASTTDDLFFDCKDHQSPEDDSLLKNTSDCKDHQSPEDDSLLKNTSAHANETHPTEMYENRLLDKMTTALSVLENTPKIKMSAVKEKLFSEKFSTNFRSEVKPPLKSNTVPPSAVALHRSKSIARLNKIITGNPCKFKGLRKRSSSLNDLRVHKKQTFPMTPMCLKRTIIKGKEKNLKTTEERELEEIAKLQKQLIQHLRYNEQTLRRLKLKPKPCVSSKNVLAKNENLKGHKGLNLNPPMEKLNAAEKEPRRNIQALSSAALKNEAMKINNIIQGPSAANKPIDTGLKDRKSKNPSSVSSVPEVKEKNKSQVAKKPIAGKKIGFHAGLVFHDNVKKSTTFQPFSFDAKFRENVKSTGPEQKSEVSLSNSILKHKVDDGKENGPYDRSQSTIRKGKTTVKNIKYDIVKQLALNKKIVGNRVTNPIRGLPLSENFARK